MTPKTISIKSPTLHATIWFTICVFAAILAMSIIFQVEVVARGQGKVVPLGRVQVIQPEFDGKITAIYAQNGMRVERGDVLIDFDTTDAVAESNTIQAELRRLEIEDLRIEALLSVPSSANPDTPTFAKLVMEGFVPPETPNATSYFQDQKRLLVAEVADLQSSFQQIAARDLANDRSVDVTRANIARVDAAIIAQQERLEVAQGLLDRGASSRSAFVDATDVFTSLQAEKEIYLKEIDQKLSQKAALDAERRGVLASLSNQRLQRRSEISARSTTLKEQLRSAERRVQSGQLLAPVDGTIDQLSTFTIGGIASAGEELMRIVPSDQAVEIEAIFTNSDVGFLEIGQTANIKLDAFPAERFGYVEGLLKDVSADAVEISEGVWGFLIRVEPNEPTLVSGDSSFDLKPGMTATIDVITDERRIISYFFAPILRTIESSLGER